MDHDLAEPADYDFTADPGKVTVDDVTLIRRPKVWFVGAVQLDNAQLDEFLAQYGPDANLYLYENDCEDTEFAVESAGRLCYLSFAKPRPGGSKAYHGHILESGHGSVLEHAVFNFIFEGVSRSLSHELVRHRAGVGISQLSQRFVDESGCEFIIPPLYEKAVRYYLAREAYNGLLQYPDGETVKTDEKKIERLYGVEELDNETGHEVFHRYADIGEAWVKAVTVAQKAYAELSDLTADLLKGVELDKTARRKRAREAARSVLPNATETKFFYTANARALRTIFEQRCSMAADAEIRRFCVDWLKIVQKHSPHLFSDFTVKPMPDGSGEFAECVHHKV